MRKEEGRSLKDTLCWHCEKACGYCSWSEWDTNRGAVRFEPVEGWETVPSIIFNGRMPVETHIVLSCPEFVQEDLEIVKDGNP